MTQSMTQSDEPIPIDHASVVKRLEEVTSSEYPFPIPERPKPDKSLRINLTSFQNLRPVLRSTLVFVVNTCCPLWAVACLVWGCYSCCFCYCTDTNSNSTSSSSKLAFSLAAVLLAKSASESFLLHYATNGRYGGLGCGGTCRTTGLPNTTAREGFFANPRNPRNARLKERLGRFVVEYAPTPYLYSGDLLTMAPFLLFKGSEGGRVPYRRYWVKVPVAPAPDGDDGPSKRPSCESDDDHDNNNNEAVALDVVFPKDGYRSDKPTFVILHGLNGGSTEPYVLDLARRATAEGHTVAVVINRGLMKTPVRGDVTFHGARTSDVGCAVDALHYALYGRSRFAKQTQAQKQTQTQNDGCPNNNSSSSSSGNNNNSNSNSSNKSNLVMVGFSMGGIIVANYAAKSGEHSGLAGALSFSGTLCTAKNLLDCPAARHSAGVWQPALAWGLKASIVKPSMHKFAKKGVTVREVEEVQSVTEIDTKLVCKYHGYKTVYDYYEDMSAGGLGDAKGLKRLDSTRIPLLAVHAIDDPITIYEVTLADEVDKTENVMLLATKHGGHIGWPTGWFPSKNRWSFMMDIAMEFASEVAVVR